VLDWTPRPDVRYGYWCINHLSVQFDWSRPCPLCVLHAVPTTNQGAKMAEKTYPPTRGELLEALRDALPWTSIEDERYRLWKLRVDELLKRCPEAR
jgi:hypothetical protein